MASPSPSQSKRARSTKEDKPRRKRAVAETKDMFADTDAEYINHNFCHYKIIATNIQGWGDRGWTVLSSKFYLLHDYRITIWKEYIVMVGSLLPFQSQPNYGLSVVMFNTQTRRTKLANNRLTLPLADFTILPYDDRFYIFGGRTLSASFSFPTDTAFYFDYLAETWHKCMRLPANLTHPISVRVDNEIYVLDRYCPLIQAYKFFPEDNYWRIVENPATIRELAPYLGLP